MKVKCPCFWGLKFFHHLPTGLFRKVDHGGFMWLLKRKASTRSSDIAKQCFDQTLETGRAIAKINPLGVVDLLRAVLRPFQSELLLGVAERGSDAVPNVEALEFFGPAFGGRFWSPDGMKLRGERLASNYFNVQLARDTVLPWAWNKGSYFAALATTGGAKEGLPSDPDGPQERWRGAWRQDPNHSLTLWLPWGIAFVNGGNHTITAGILAAEGSIQPSEVYDMSYLLDEVHCDGRHFIDRATGHRIAPVSDYRRAAAFELGRLMRESGYPNFREEARLARHAPPPDKSDK